MERKKIAIDARFLTRPMRGMPLYLFNLCKELPRLMPEVDFLLFLNTGFEHNLPPEKYQAVLDAVESNPRVKRHDLKHSADPYWEQILLPLALRRHRVDLLFMPGNRRPYFSPCPTVVTVHDVIEYIFLRQFYTAPPGAGIRARLYSLRHGLYLLLTYRFMLPRSEEIVAVSHHAKSEIVAQLRIPGDRITVIHHGLPEGYGLANPSDSLPFSERGFCLMLGGDGYQKNPEGALEAWAAVPVELRRQWPLRIVGFTGDPQSPLLLALNRLGLQSEVRVEGWLSEADLQRLFKEAALFIFLSRYEGFGFPLLQAMAAGTPSVYAGAASLPELGGEGGLAVPPENACAAGDAIVRLLTQKEVWEKCREAGWKRAEEFSWEASARAHARVFARLRGGPGKLNSRLSG